MTALGDVEGILLALRRIENPVEDKWEIANRFVGNEKQNTVQELIFFK